MEEYIYQKKRILIHFGIHLTEEQLEYMKLLETQISIDNFVHSLILNALND